MPSKLNSSSSLPVSHQDLDIMEAMDGWLHCFWEPERYIPYGLPRMLMSESDFYEPTRNDSDGVLVPKKLPKKYDFLYVNGVSSEPQRAVHNCRDHDGRASRDMAYNDLEAFSILQGGAWNDYNRNWTLAHDAIVMFARDLNLTTLIVGHSLVEYPEMAPYIDQGLIIPSQKRMREHHTSISPSCYLLLPECWFCCP